MKIVVLAAGSLGSVIGGALANAGNEVHLVARKRFVDVINEKGLTLVEPTGETNVRVAAHETAEGIGVADLVIVLCKAYDTKATVEGATEIIGPDTVVLSLQNGLGAEDIMADLIGAEHVIGGKTYVSGMILEPGRVQAGIKLKDTLIGELDGSITPRVEEIGRVFNEAGLNTIVSDNIMGVIWDKLLINVSTGAICAITGLPYGPVYDSEELSAIAVAAVQEGIDVAKAAGVTLKFATPEESYEYARYGLERSFKPSLLQSLEKGRMTEVDVIAGAVVREGKKHGVPTPVNQMLVAFVHGVETYVKENGSWR